MDKKIIVGLGNPGAEFIGTRHNLGFMVIDALHKRFGISPWKKQNKSLICKAKICQRDVILAKPQTYMNLSGKAILSLMTFFKEIPANFLIVLDDFAIPFGVIRFRAKGGDGGHKGLLSIIQETGRRDFPRLRVGIGPPPEGIEPANFVLSSFTNTEKEKLPQIIDACVKGTETFVSLGIEEAMSQYNGLKILV